ncbi:MAG: flagellar motor switch protein FliG, partial [Verrucomicrobia bacterium]|nr:flagellar motor switch protein FliG [Verrucomicrobiota bacterium]
MADLIREEILSFEIFVELDDLKLQEVLVELMRGGAPGLFLQQAPLSVREHVRENLSSY